MYKCVLFDMDGTLVNTYEGIFNSYAYAFEKMNMSFEGTKIVGKAIGAPLLEVFKTQCGLQKEQAVQATKYYREYYARKGKYEAILYEGIKETLRVLKEHNCIIAVTTLKKESFAKDILKQFELLSYFDAVYGMDEHDTLSKSDLLRRCIKNFKMDVSDTVLVGDSEYDELGALEVGIDFLGVLYGFGFKKRQLKSQSLMIDSGHDISRSLEKMYHNKLKNTTEE